LSPTDRDVVRAQLGREPRGDIEVSARCPFGLPLVVTTAPRLHDDSPFPTLYYLTCPVAVRAIGRLEAAGAMRAYEERLATEPELAAEYAQAHERYVRARDALAPLGRDESAGGMPDRVKCLHALYAHERADANPIGALVRADIEPIDCPGVCVDESGARVEAHPGFQGKKRRR
jgi:hypothetical protein